MQCFYHCHISLFCPALLYSCNRKSLLICLRKQLENRLVYSFSQTSLDKILGRLWLYLKKKSLFLFYLLKHFVLFTIIKIALHVWDF